MCQTQQRPQREKIPAPLLNSQSLMRSWALHEVTHSQLATDQLFVFPGMLISVLIIREAMSSTCSPQVGGEIAPEFPLWFSEKPHTFRDEPFHKKPMSSLVLE